MLFTFTFKKSRRRSWTSIGSHLFLPVFLAPAFRLRKFIFPLQLVVDHFNGQHPRVPKRVGSIPMFSSVKIDDSTWTETRTYAVEFPPIT